MFFGWWAPATLALLLSLVVGCANAPSLQSETASTASDAYETRDTERAAAWFEEHRDQPPALRIFLQRMPKGGDLHSHLSGAVYAESYLGWGAEENYCVREVDEEMELLKCVPGDPRLTPLATLTDSKIYNRLIDRMSTRNLAFAERTGHSDFFAAFRAASPVSRLREGEVVAEVATRAAEQTTYYLELMISPQNLAVRELGRQIGLRADLASTRDALLEAGLADLVAAGRDELDKMEEELQRVMDCDGANASPGCEVTIRFLQQTSRNRTPAEVFAQLSFAFEIARADPRMVGLNLISPEDDRVALRDYTAHMQMLAFLSSTAPEPVNIALHAGELTLGLVPPEDLRFHIREAVEVARAHRIGHGVDIAYENDALELLAVMRERGVLVEICLTSNDIILDVRDDEHPLPLYLEAGVPLALATDDEGISRIDLSHEFLRAALSYDLGYRDLKTMARNSLAHSFLPGASLWQQPGEFALTPACANDTPGSGNPTRACANFLAASERAWEQWRLEAELLEFETLNWAH
ncbi:MAG: adenosine deaminase [Deltaproteobacteria bacterium]|nr:adenosine deaminase [Deltaproteobacteria bacterium]